MRKESDETTKRRKALDKALGILSTAAKMPTDSFMDAMEECIKGNISIEDLNKRIDNMEFI